MMYVTNTVHTVGMFKDIRNRYVLQRQYILFVARKPSTKKMPTGHIYQNIILIPLTVLICTIEEVNAA